MIRYSLEQISRTFCGLLEDYVPAISELWQRTFDLNHTEYAEIFVATQFDQDATRRDSGNDIHPQKLTLHQRMDWLEY